ncbi:hypothetical protein [Roseomonas sp. USHLN139]|uniref:hypothetical protein n=1 Tax=Roseomonas sp. USHLN139 TaxID=3081298 RepID=UPI003B02C41E
MPAVAEDRIARDALAALIQAIDDLVARGDMAAPLAPGLLRRTIAHLPPSPRRRLVRAARQMPWLRAARRGAPAGPPIAP